MKISASAEIDLSLVTSNQSLATITQQEANNETNTTR